MKIREVLARFRGQREFHADIIGRRRIWFLLSGAVVAISAFALFIPGPNLGIDFTGGAILELDNRAGATADEVRDEMARLGREGAVVQLVADEQDKTITVRTESLGSERPEILEGLAALAGVEPSNISVQDIGPKWGRQISAKAIQALVIFLVVVVLYISFRFEWKMAIAAIVALFHDLVITFGVYALTGREVTPEAVIAILTILGYSLYDTVVIFDKVKENTESLSLVSRETYAGTVNLSLNQVLMRSVNTSLVVLFPVGALMLFGGETLQNFAFALFVGIVVGTYSSIFVASPLLAVLKEREPRLAQIRSRAERRETRPPLRAVSGDGPAEREPARELEAVGTAPKPPPTSTARRKAKRKPRSKRKRR